MPNGLLADQNLAKTSAISGGDWSADLPISNLIVGSYLGQPARCAAPADLANSQFEMALAIPRAVTLVGVLFHTLSSTAQYRISIASIGETLDAPVYRSDWTPVVGRLYDSSVLEWEDPNWWTGQPDPDDLALYPPHLWIPVQPAIIATAIRIEIDDTGNEAGFFDLGGLWIARTWSPEINYERGRELGSDARSVLDEAPSGRMFNERRQGRRYVTVNWAALQDAEAYRLFDAGQRAGTTEEVLFVPNLDDVVGLTREAFPATFEKPPSTKFNFQGLNVVAATFKEIIA
jgi:hypothetical protein